jgi:phosphoadenosine phosphosulfate reductase
MELSEGKWTKLGIVGWCFNCNVPILDSKPCGICSSETQPLPFSKGSLKPVFSEEKKFYNSIIDLSLGIPQDLLPQEECFVSNGSIVVDGRRVFKIFFTDNEWRAESYGNYEVGDLNGSNLKQVIKANEYILREKEKEAIDFLKKVIEKFDLPVVVSISGGKDSTVALWLARKVDRNIKVIYMNTTLDFPETVEYVHRLKREWNLNFIEIFPEHSFLDLAKKLGPPSSMMPWCCQTQKFAPFSKYLNEHYPKGVISIEGLRRFESEKRMNYKRISVNRAIPRKKAVCPILNWTMLDVWLYIFWKKLPFNPIYNYGYERIGCWACPHKSMSSFKLMEKTHSELLNKWYSFLQDYAFKNGKDKEWVLKGNWRFRREAYEKIPIHSKRLCGADNVALYEIKDRAALARAKEFVKIFGEVKSAKNIQIVQGQGIQISIIGSNVRISAQETSMVKKFEKQLLRAMNCIACGACVGVCKALKVRNKMLTIDEKRCTHCLKCVTSKYLRMSCIALNYKKKRFVWRECSKKPPKIENN